MDEVVVKVKPFPNAQMIITKSQNHVILNLVDPSAPESMTFYMIYKNGKIYNSMKEEANIIYAISYKPVSFPNASKKKKVMDIKVPKGITFPPRIKSEIKQWSGGEFNYQLIIGKRLDLRMISVIDLMLKYGRYRRYAFYGNIEGCILYEEKIKAQTSNSLLDSAGYVLPTLTNAYIEKIIKQIYYDRLYCAAIYLLQNEWPILEEVIKNKKEYASRLSTSSPGLYEIRYYLITPPIPIEDVLHLQNKIEAYIFPESLDIELMLTSENKELFEKVRMRLPELIQESNDAITFRYSALLDMEQIFTYGEFTELATQARIIQ